MMMNQVIQGELWKIKDVPACGDGTVKTYGRVTIKANQGASSKVV